MHVDQLRQQILDRVLGVGDLTAAGEDWAWWRVPGKSPVHREVCVGTPDSRWERALDGRQRPDRGTVAVTEVHVAVSCQLASHDQRATSDDALQLEAAIRARLLAREAGSELAPAWPAGLSIFWTGSKREAGREAGWLYLDSTFEVTHPLPLQ